MSDFSISPSEAFFCLVTCALQGKEKEDPHNAKEYVAALVEKVLPEMTKQTREEVMLAWERAASHQEPFPNTKIRT